MTSLAAPARPRFLADVIPGAITRDILLVIAAAGLLIVGGQIVIPLPFTPVPLSLGTFIVIMSAATLGPARGLSSVGLYLALGLAGLPVYAQQGSGWFFASFGYILGYFAATAVVGFLAKRRADRTIGTTVALAALGSIAVYACGAPWLAAFLNVSFGEALMMGVVPFLIGDAIKIVVAAVTLPTLWKLADRRRDATAL